MDNLEARIFASGVEGSADRELLVSRRKFVIVAVATWLFDQGLLKGKKVQRSIVGLLFPCVKSLFECGTGG